MSTAMRGGWPLVGRTRALDELRRALESSLLEVGGAPAFWPWIEVLRGVTDGVSDADLGAMLGPTASDIVQLVPELAARAGVTSVPPLAPSGERFRLFDAVDTLIQRRAAASPLVVLSAMKRQS